MEARGVVLQASYRIHAGLPVVHVYGRLEDGGTFLVRDHRHRPHFYIQAQDAHALENLDGVTLLPSEQTTFSGASTTRVEVRIPSDVPPLRDRLESNGVETFEADVRFAVRYLIDRRIRGGCVIRGHAQTGDGVDWVFDDPEVAAADVTVDPRVLSFDIETDRRAEHLLAISLYGLGVDEVLLVDPHQRPVPEHARSFAGEREVLDAFCHRVAELDPDVLTGWNVVDFDLRVLSRMAERLRHPFQLGRGRGELRIRPAQGYFGSGSATIPGRLVLDGMDLLRGAFVRMDDYSLDAVARRVLGEGKALEGDAHDRVDEIMERYRRDLPGFARYARADARLALQIVEQLDLVHLASARSRLTGMTPDRVAASIASFDFLYLCALGERRVAAPSVRSDDSRVHAAQAGGAVFEPVTGLHDNVLVFDFKSLYPSIIRTFNIDPLGWVAPGQARNDVIRLVTDCAFRRGAAILPQMLDDLFPRREAAKRSGDAVASQAIKILMNSFYGVLGTPACRFYNPAIANAITGQGRHLLQWCRSWLEQRGLQVLYGDTDSLFVSSGVADAEDAQRAGAALVDELNHHIAAYVEDRWKVVSRLELEFEKLYVQLFLPSVRHGDAGARKRYAGRLAGAPDVEFVGMEVVRRDWTELAKVVQRELYTRLFAGDAVNAYLADVVRRVRQGEFDDLLVYRKGLRKSLESYTASTPPHVAAARKSPEPPGRIVSYLMTVAGPEPLNALEHEPDREHYVDRQIKPVAEPVLGALGLDFAQVIGDDRQLGLF